MLSQFSVKNFKSIKEEVTFDMQATAITEHADRVIKASNNESLLPVASLYGPNGGGKSNVLQALHSLELKVLRPLYATEADAQNRLRVRNYELVPFAFDENSKNSPTEFEVFFLTEKAEYRYIIYVLGERIIYESLSMRKVETNRTTEIFEREDGKIDMGDGFARLKVSQDISDTLPLLSYLGITYRKNEVIDDCISWFENGIRFLNYGSPMQELRLAIANSTDIKELILNMIREMDLDIEDFKVEKRENGDIQVFTRHNVAGNVYEINLAEESSGTKKIFGLLPFIADSLTKGITLVIDELDAKIHPLLLKHIIMLYNNLEINKHGAQLIFTSHDLSTMNSEIFRRDEIWFVAKGNEQNSKLYSLVEFKNPNGTSVRKDAKFDKQYLEGKYGADPYLKKIIDWSVI
ncbi:AAA family ATPase [Butyrivibrio proteoclasticus]|uniref:AAA family ATPase n=1 Tax=Butyrivibrio proteoclasticus TaxID=43305 RepID=UPI000478BAAD|nr:ATP-binding protein [Butyrivibrio proteoclasticus]